MQSYSAKTALITGASTGIGRSFALDLAKRGAKLILVARSGDKLEALASELKAAHRTEVTVIPMDLSQPNAAAALFTQVTQRGLAVDLLVNNAGFGKWGHFRDSDTATYAEMVDLNIKAVVELCHAFLPDMAARGDCGVLNIGSTASFIPVPWSAVYAATKAFVLSFSEALHYEYRERGIVVTCLCPGATDTQFAMTAYATDANRARFGDAPDQVAKIGLDALLAGKSTVIAGASNHMVAVLPRLLPRSATLRVAGEAWRRILKSRGIKV